MRLSETLLAITLLASACSDSVTGSSSDGGTLADGSVPTDSGTTTDGGGGSATGQWVMGYYVGYAINMYPINQIDWSGLTHIVFSPMTVKSDLTPDLSFSDQNGTGPQDAMALAQAAHAHGVKALLMLGGAGAGGNIATAAMPANRAAFVSKLVNTMSTLGYDGIDLDWEDNVNFDDLVGLAQALRTARPSMLLTYPAGMINGNYQTVDPRMGALAQYLDRFFVQSYYPSTAFAGSGWSSWFLAPLSGASSATPIATDDTLNRYQTAGVPKSKLGIGTGFYAICYTGGISAPRQPTNGTTQRIVGGDNDYPLSTFFAANSTFANSATSAKMRDATASAPYLSLSTAVADSHCGASTQYISYEDEASLIAKGTFSKQRGYGGIIIWTLNEGWLPAGATGGRQPNALMQALKQGFLTP